jgi:argininosuccinate lyase
MLALLKGLPLAYNRDLQEDKVALFGAVSTTRRSLLIAARVARTLKIYPERMEAMTRQGFLTATDLADELVCRGVPFAEAHELVGKLVRYCSERGQTFGDLTIEQARRLIPAWDAKMQAIANSPQLSVERRKGIGGTAPSQVARQVASAERAAEQLERRLARS